MRYPAEQKAETHEKILTTAARSFREHGSERNGIGQVMNEVAAYGTAVKVVKKK